MDEVTRENAVAWNVTAKKYEPDIGKDVSMVRSGGTSLLGPELSILRGTDFTTGPPPRRIIHLQCSHGLDLLSLWKLFGASELVGIDISSAMLSQAREKSSQLGAPAEWIEADVLTGIPESVMPGDLVYTGRGALPWIRDIGIWANVVLRLVKPGGGRLLVFEGHPLTWVWDCTSTVHVLRTDGSGYFDHQPRQNTDFPGQAIEQFSSSSSTAAGTPRAREFHWNLGEIVTAVSRAGLIVDRLEEFPDQFWPQFESISGRDLSRLPHTFALVAHRP